MSHSNGKCLFEWPEVEGDGDLRVGKKGWMISMRAIFLEMCLGDFGPTAGVGWREATGEQKCRTEKVCC